MNDLATLPGLWPDSDPSILAPVAEHEDLRSVARAILAGRGPTGEAGSWAEQGPTEAWRRLTAELDLGAIALPEVLGGAGYGARELAVVLEEVGGALASEPVLSSAVLAVQALATAVEPEEVAELLEQVVAGRVVATAWLGPSDALTLGADGSVDGHLTRLLHGDVAAHVVAPATGPEGPVLVAASLEGAERRTLDHVDPTRTLVDARLQQAPAAVLVSAGGFARVRRRLDALRDVAVAAEHAGMVARLLDLTVEHVETRHQFGRAIGSFQAVKHRLADVLVARERCRSAVRYAAARYDVDPDSAGPAAAVAAAVALDAVLATAHEAIQLHGGIGFTWEHPAHLYLRRALGDEAQFGSARQHRGRLADLLGL